MTVPGLLLLVVASATAQAGRPSKAPVDFRLQDQRGAWHTLDEARESKIVVLAFVGTECPLAEAYAPRLAELARGFEKRGVRFFGVDANQQDGPVAIGRFADAHGLPFPILKDVGNELADIL
jgi:peroxiredoxin